MITRYLPTEPQADFPPRRWDQLRRDVADFLASSWPAEAARLRLDRARPLRRRRRPALCPHRDGFGLLPVLNGGRIVELTDVAILETPGGARHRYRRQPDRPGRVLVWEVGS